MPSSLADFCSVQHGRSTFSFLFRNMRHILKKIVKTDIFCSLFPLAKYKVPVLYIKLYWKLILSQHSHFCFQFKVSFMGFLDCDGWLVSECSWDDDRWTVGGWQAIQSKWVCLFNCVSFPGSVAGANLQQSLCKRRGTPWTDHKSKTGTQKNHSHSH